VLYLHGLGMTRRWLPFHEELAGHCDLIAPEHPGFGESELPDWLLGIDDVVLHYADLANVLDLPTFHLIGYSFGGWIAAELAVFYPERLRSLVLIEAMGLRVPGHTPADVFRMTHERYADALFNDDAASYDDYLADGNAKETLIQWYAELTAMARVAWNPRYDYKLDRRLGRITCPTTVIAADEDRVMPRQHAERYAELIPNARLVTVSGERAPTGHGIVAQEPVRLAEQIARALEG
jgi:pimeloyl-ACP methyl ester carboxylesterase